MSKRVLLLLSPSPREIFGKAMQHGLTPSSFLIIIIQEGLFLTKLETKHLALSRLWCGLRVRLAGQK